MENLRCPKSNNGSRYIFTAIQVGESLHQQTWYQEDLGIIVRAFVKIRHES